MEYMDHLAENGFVQIKQAVTQKDVIHLIDCTNAVLDEITPHGVRNLLRRLPCINSFIQSDSIRKIIEPVLGMDAKPVRAIFFDKIPEANWNVAWHQDTTIAVKQKAEMEGFRNWTEKAGVFHTEPPLDVLENLLTLRLHLDRADEENGVLRVVPGSHSLGRVKSNRILELVEQGVVTECLAEAGDILLMKPLLFHSSRKSLMPSHRRIIHIEYSSYSLPRPLEWSDI